MAEFVASVESVENVRTRKCRSCELIYFSTVRDDGTRSTFSVMLKKALLWEIV